MDPQTIPVSSSKELPMDPTVRKYLVISLMGKESRGRGILCLLSFMSLHTQTWGCGGLCSQVIPLKEGNDWSSVSSAERERLAVSGVGVGE